MAVPADDLVANPDSNQPIVAIVVTANFYTVCLHIRRLQRCPGDRLIIVEMLNRYALSFERGNHAMYFIDPR